MNGGPIPNWVKLAGMGLMLGLQGAGVWYAQARKVDEVVATQNSLVEASKTQIESTKALTQEVRETNDYLEDTVAQANKQHRQMWEAIGKPQRMVEIPTRREWQNHQWEWQK